MTEDPVLVRTLFPIQSVDRLATELNRLYSYYHSWRHVSLLLGDIPAGSLNAYANGRPLKNTVHRKIFGLPPIVEVEACSECGEVHLKKSCDQQHAYNYKDLFAIPTKKLAKMLENRETMEICP